jgi:hypothetical protein
MLQRSPSRGAARARASRARRKAGIGTYLVRAHTRQLTASLRLANRDLGDDLTRAEIEAELDALVAAFIDRWLRRKPYA